MATADFELCHFHRPAYFRRTKLASAKFDSCLVDDQLEFDQAELLQAEFNGAPLEKFRFTACLWPTLKGRIIVYEAKPFLEDKQKQEIEKTDRPNTNGDHKKELNSGIIQDIFRRLKKVAKTEHDEELAGDWHYWEKEMQLLASNGLSKLLLKIYKTLSGYGESWQRAGLWLLLSLILPILAGGIVHLSFKYLPDTLSPGWGVVTEINSWWSGQWSDWLPFAKMTGKINGIYVDRGLLGDALIGAYRIIVTGLTALFLFALRNKMRR